jgi:hypothetical protein
MTREPLRTRPGGEPAGLERVERPRRRAVLGTTGGWNVSDRADRVARQNDLARLDARIAQLRRGTHPQASETPLPAWALTQRSGQPADPRPASSQVWNLRPRTPRPAPRARPRPHHLVPRIPLWPRLAAAHPASPPAGDPTVKLCTRPPSGWRCRRGLHVDGLCALVPTVWNLPARPWRYAKVAAR